MNSSPGHKPSADDAAWESVESRHHGVPDALLQRAMAGDRRAVGDVMAFVRPMVERYCRARLGPQDRPDIVVDDVVQEVCMAVLVALPGLRGRNRPFLAFVYGIASQKVVEVYAGTRARPTRDVGAPAELTHGGGLGGRLARLLGTLPEKQREILVLRIVAGLSAEETAEAVGSTPGAVRVAQHRALAQLRMNNTAEGGGTVDVIELLADLDEEPLRLSHRSYVGALAATLDVDGGLAHLQDRRDHREFVEGLAGQLNLDAGLSALLRDAEAPDQ